MSEETLPKWIVKRGTDQEEFRSVCGFRKSLLTTEDQTRVSLSHLRINDSREHYHKQLEEVYYILQGTGAIVLDGERVEVSPGDSLVIRPGVRHHSEGDMEVLIICCPPHETSDVFFDD